MLMVCVIYIFFRRYRGRWVHFSCFTLPDSFSAVPRTSGLVFIFFSSRLVLGGTEGVRSIFQVLRSQTRFRRYRWRRFQFSRFALPDSFWTVPKASCQIFMLRELPNSFSAIQRVSGPLFMICAPGLVFGGSEGTRSSFHVLSF
jgi:hypothetical protein